MSPNPPYLRYIFILSPYLHRGLQSNIISSRVPITNLYAALFSPMHEICPTHRTLLDMNIVMMLGHKDKSWHSTLLSILPPYFIFPLLISKYSITTRFSVTLGCILVSVWETSLGPIPNKSNIILTYFRLVFMNVEKRHKVLNQTVANTPPI